MATYYLDSVNGVDSVANDGSESQPWKTFSYLQDIKGVLAGNTVIFKPGVYPNIQVTTIISTTNPTFLISQEKWKAVVDYAPSPYVHGINSGGNSHALTIDGFEVRGAPYDGIKVEADYCTVKNCWIHHNSGQGIAIHSRKYATIESNLVENNGNHIQYCHGVYAGGQGYLVRNNIIRHNGAYGLHLYNDTWDSRVEGNLIYGHNRPGIYVNSAAGLGNNDIINNTSAFNSIGIYLTGGTYGTVANNLLYENTTHAYVASSVFNTMLWTNNLLWAPTKWGSTDTPMYLVNTASYTTCATPLFADHTKGVYWLGTTSSPAIGAGATAYTPTRDFWGAAYTGTSYIGAFPYVASLADPNYRATWNGGYAYNYMPSGIPQVPDFWTI